MALTLPHDDESIAPAQRLALKIDVDTLRGALIGVPALIETLRRCEANATFLFALGPDQSGRALKRIVGAGGSRGRVKPMERVGFAGLWHGTLLPAPLLGVKAEAAIRQAAEAGFEVGIRSWSRHAWANRAPDADAAWTRDQMQFAHDRFVQIFGTPPRIHGACDWQMSRHAFRLTQRLGFDYCSDTRGSRPFVPVIDAEIVACPQIPTTLPTFDELLADPSANRDDVDARMLQAIRQAAPEGHVLTLSADAEGIALRPVLERLLEHLAQQDMRLLSLGQYLGAASGSELPRFRVETATLPGSSLPLAMQFKEFLA